MRDICEVLSSLWMQSERSGPNSSPSAAAAKTKAGYLNIELGQIILSITVLSFWSFAIVQGAASTPYRALGKTDILMKVDFILIVKGMLDMCSAVLMASSIRLLMVVPIIEQPKDAWVPRSLA